jgi:glutaredoxin
MSRICPHCNHARQPGDVAPEWQCPSCARAYAKGVGVSLSAPGISSVQPGRTKAGVGKWLLVLFAFGMAFLAIRSLPQLPGNKSELVPLAGQPEVILYATEWCGYCKKTRAFFAANGIRYVEHDIEKNSAARDEHRRLGGNGVPLIVVGDEVIKGYSEQALRQSLGAWIAG